MCWKAGCLPTSGGGGLKRVDERMFTTLMVNHCMAFYTSLDGVHIDRVAYYYNPPEDQLVWEDNDDSDGDDPQLYLDSSDPRFNMDLLVDDKGSFMRRRWRDADLTYDKYYDSTYYSRADGLPNCALDSTGLTGCGDYDLGDVMADGFSDITFWYVYTLPGDPKLYYADKWPYTEDPGTTTSDKTGLAWGAPPLSPEVGCSYLTVPLGVQIDFHYDLDGADRILSKLMFIYSSKWQELQSYQSP